MKSKTRSSTPALILALAAWTSQLIAAPVITTATNTPAAGTATTSTTDETIYSGDVSTTDLLHGITGTGGTWNAGGSSPAGLNNGTGAGDSNVTVANGLNGAAWAANGTVSFREFVIGNGTNGLGYNITEVQSIAAWQGASFQNQKYEILVSTVGSAAFTLLATVDFQPASGTSGSVQGGATKVNVTDSTGILATSVDAIRFNILDSSGATGGGTVFREIDVFGVSTLPETTAPQISTLAPLDDASGVLIGSNLVATFSENIAIGTGNITIKNIDTSALTVIPVGDSQISISAKILTINPSANLTAGTNYAIQIDTTAIKDLTNNPFAGISDDTTWNFITNPDVTAPAISTLSPADDATTVPGNSNLMLTFSENFALGSGNITIKNLSTSTQIVIPVGDPQVSVSGAVLTINPTLNLAPLTNYAIGIDATAITDMNTNLFAGIADDTSWNFTTKAADAQEFSSTELAYSAEGSTSDLLNGLTATAITGWNNTNGAQLSELNDGIHGGTYTVAGSVAGAWTTVGATAEYNLGTGTGGAGYNITSIQSIAAWNGVGFGNQAWTVEVKPVSGNWTALSTVNYQPLAASAGGATKVTLTDPGGVLASGIQFIRFTAIQVNGGAIAGAFIWRELDVFGVATTAGNTYANWIGTFPAAAAMPGFAQDADGDGIKNGVENFFGSNPGEFNPGLVAGGKTANTFTFTHPQGNTLASDLTASYRWSTDLATFLADGASNGGTTVNFTTQPNIPVTGTTTVTATVIGTALDKIFVTVGVTQN